MKTNDYDVWADLLFDKYGIADPIADESDELDQEEVA